MEPDDSTTHRKEIDSICLILNGKMSHLLTTENWTKNSCNVLGSQQFWQHSTLRITVLFVSNWQFFAKFHIAFCLFTFQCGFPISSFMERQFQRSNQKHFIKGKSLEIFRQHYMHIHGLHKYMLMVIGNCSCQFEKDFE